MKEKVSNYWEIFKIITVKLLLWRPTKSRHARIFSRSFLHHAYQCGDLERLPVLIRRADSELSLCDLRQSKSYRHQLP